MKYRFQFVFLLAPVLAAQDRPATQAPLINRELLFASPEITAAQLSPDGKYVTFIKPWADIANVWVKEVGEPLSAARLVTAETLRAVPTFLWTHDGKYLCYLKDKTGDGTFNVYAVDPAAPVPSGEHAPPGRALTELQGASAQLFGASRTNPDLIYIGINDRDRNWYDLYELKVSTGKKTLLRKNTDRINAWFLTPGGLPRMAVSTAENGDRVFLRVDPDKMVAISSCGPYENCTPLRLDKEGRRAYLLSNTGAGQNFEVLVLLDLTTGKAEVVDADPLRRCDLASATFSDRTDEPIYTVYADGRQRRYFKDKEFEADFKWVEGKLPGKDLGLGSIVRNDQLWLVNAYGDTEPGETYVFDRKAHTLSLQFKVLETLPRAELAVMEPVHYRSTDGLDIPALLTLPKGGPAKDLPALVIPHGGPWTHDVWGYNAMAQFFANRGYAVLMPNFRGSAGYGKKFLDAGNGEWGRKMQDDLNAGVQYLIGRGTTDPKRVGILGSVYGGYAALAAVAFSPDRYRAAVSISGPPNLVSLLDSFPMSMELFRNMMYARVGDPRTPAGVATLKERSPLTSAGRIKAPVLLVLGPGDSEDTRMETEQIVAGLRERKIPVEYLRAGGEGKSFTRPVNHLAMLTAAEKFLAKNLGGRYEEDTAPDVARRVGEITIDPATVTVPKPAEAGAPASPKLVSNLKPGVYRYQNTIVVDEKKTVVVASITVEEKNGAWLATEVTKTEKGSSTDAAVLDKGTLAERKRSIKQGASSLEIDFSGGRATGKIDANGQEHSVSSDVGGAPFADSGGALQSIGCLPLAEGYSLTYRNFDLQRMKAKVMNLKVVSSETVKVPAGSFEAFVVELSSAENPGGLTRIWVSQKGRLPVKTVTTSTARPGASITAELLPSEAHQ